jgi:nitrite reductase/ring-hydroxylating ferredoxin subunit
MGKCAQCGNDYDKSFEVKMGGRTMIFDSFECAIQALAPVCPHCGCRIIGHGVEHGDTIFCCVHLRQAGRRQRPTRPRLGVKPKP